MGLAADVGHLPADNYVHGAALLDQLGETAHASTRAFDGSLIYFDEPLGRTWLALWAFEQEWLAAGE